MKTLTKLGALLTLALVAHVAHAQQQNVNCAPATPCNAVTGPSFTGTGDPAWQAFGKLNANNTQLYGMFGTGNLKATGSANAADIIRLWGTVPATCSATSFLRGDGNCATTPVSANPSATIGLSAVNGTAATFLTSDSAPALSQAIVPTWSALHTFTGGVVVGVPTGGSKGANTINSPLANTYLDGTAFQGIAPTWTGQHVFNAPSGQSAIFVNGAGAAAALVVNGGSTDTMTINTKSGGAANALDITGATTTDDRTTILFTAQVSSTKQYSIGVSTAGGATKSFDVRDITRNVIPFSIATGGTVTILQPSVTTALGANIPSIQSNGTTFTLGTGTGACTTTTTLTGGAAAGSFLCTGTAGASTQVVNLPTATNGWSCWAADETSGTGWAQSAHATNSVTLKGTIATTSDRVVFGCMGY